MMDLSSAKDDVASKHGDAERRNNLRYKVNLRVQLIGADSLPMQVETTDISIAGWHFECDQWTAQHLMPPGEQVIPAKGKQFTARFKIPDNGDGRKTLTLITKVIGVQRLAQDKFRANMRFVRFGGPSYELLQKYLKSL